MLGSHSRFRWFRSAAVVAVLGSCAAAAITACGDDTVVMSADAGAGQDATTGADAAADAEDGGEASCEVDAGALDAAAVALGQQLVASHKCTKCHGDTLTGNNDGVSSPTTEGGLAYPPNLTPDPGTGLGCWTNAQIANAILNGIDNQDMPLCPPMPKFGHLGGDAGLDPEEAAAIAEYLRSLMAQANNVPNTPNCNQLPEEAGPPDAGPDATSDAGPEPDATTGDAGPADATTSDATSGDAATSDATTGDASASDAATSDAAPESATDDAAPESAPSD